MGPVLVKELIEIARKKRYYFNRILYGVALLVTLFLVWEENRWRIRMASGGRIKVMADVAEEFFIAFSIVQYSAVYLFVPLFLVAVIAGEREERTLELLFTTTLTDREIVLGKLASRLAVMACIILSGLPVVSLIMFFGGIDPEAVWRILAATLLAMLFTGAHAIYFSTTTRTPLGALVRTYWWMAVWLVGVPIAIMLPVAAVVRGPAAGLLLYAVAALLFTNPIGPFVTALIPEAYDEMTRHLGDWFFPFTLVLPTVWSIFLIHRAIKRVRWDPVPFTMWRKRMPVLRSLAAAWAAFPRPRALTWLTQFRPEQARFGLRVVNPLWLRARLVRAFDRERYVGRIQALGWGAAFFFLVLMALFNPRDLDDEECSQAFLVSAWLGVAALTVLFAGTSLIGDRRRGFLDLVLVTPLTAREVIDGTGLAIWEHMRRIYWLPWVLGLFFSLNGASPAHGVLCSLITATLACILFAQYGIACSAVARTFPAALVATFVFPVFINGGTGLLIGIFEEDHAPALWFLTVVALVVGSVWVHRRLTVASVATYLTAVHLFLGCVFTFWTYDGRTDEYPLLAMHPGMQTFVLLDDRIDRYFPGKQDWFSVVSFYWAALAVNIVWVRWWTIRHFDQLVGRTTKPVAAGFPGLNWLARPVTRRLHRWLYLRKRLKLRGLHETVRQGNP